MVGANCRDSQLLGRKKNDKRRKIRWGRIQSAKKSLRFRSSGVLTKAHLKFLHHSLQHRQIAQKSTVPHSEIWLKEIGLLSVKEYGYKGG